MTEEVIKDVEFTETPAVKAPVEDSKTLAQITEELRIQIGELMKVNKCEKYMVIVRGIDGKDCFNVYTHENPNHQELVLSLLGNANFNVYADLFQKETAKRAEAEAAAKAAETEAVKVEEEVA
jgi:hypothetical protein